MCVFLCVHEFVTQSFMTKCFLTCEIVSLNIIKRVYLSLFKSVRDRIICFNIVVVMIHYSRSWIMYIITIYVKRLLQYIMLMSMLLRHYMLLYPGI